MKKRNEKHILGIVLSASAIIGTALILRGGISNKWKAILARDEIVDSDGGGGVKNGFISGGESSGVRGGIAESSGGAGNG